MRDVSTQISGHAFQAANRNRLTIEAFAPAGGLAGPIAGAPQYAGENVRFPVEHVGAGVFALRDEPDVFRNIGMRWARPLAIDNFVVVVWILNVGRFHAHL